MGYAGYVARTIQGDVTMVEHTDKTDGADEASRATEAQQQKSYAADIDHDNVPDDDEDRAQLIVSAAGALLVGALYFVLPDHLSLGPRWALLVVVAVLLAPSFIGAFFVHRRLPIKLARTLGMLLLAVLTLALVGSLSMMVHTLSTLNSPVKLLEPAALLWSINIMVFGSWYWEIDGKGSKKRRESGYKPADFLFPQQAYDNLNLGRFEPHYIDYIYVAFGFATAFSPTDTPPLSRVAKLLTMAEAIISLVIVVLLVARSVNIIH